MPRKSTLTLSNPKRGGKGSRECQRCHSKRGLIRSYGLYICRRCFRETAYKMGFKKYD